MSTQTITRKKLTFGKGNEVKGWFKLTDGTKTEFSITNDGEIQHSGKSEVHPFLIELYTMLFCVE